VHHPDYHAFSIARSVLGFRLFYRYVYDIGVAYRMWTRLGSRMQPAPLWFEMGVSPENYASSRDGILADLREFLEGPVTDLEMERAKGTLVQRFALGQQTVMGQASLAGALVVEGREEELRSYAETIRSVTPEEMKEVARRYWDPERYWLVVVGPEAP
jgi:zinc protease